MYKVRKRSKTTLKVNKDYKGETIEEKMNRIINNKEPIQDGAPLIFTERKDGVIPAYNIRTDRFDIACEAMDYVSRSNTAKREGKGKIVGIDEETKKNETKGQSTDTTKGETN